MFHTLAGANNYKQTACFMLFMLYHLSSYYCNFALHKITLCIKQNNNKKLHVKKTKLAKNYYCHAVIYGIVMDNHYCCH